MGFRSADCPAAAGLDTASFRGPNSGACVKPTRLALRCQYGPRTFFRKKFYTLVSTRVRNYPYTGNRRFEISHMTISSAIETFEEVSTLTDKGQTTVPKSVRKALGLAAG